MEIKLILATRDGRVLQAIAKVEKLETLIELS